MVQILTFYTFVLEMKQTKLKYLVSLCVTLLCANFLLFAAGNSYFNLNTLTLDGQIQQNGPQKRSYTSAQNLIVKIQTDTDEDNDLEDEDTEEEASQENVCSSKKHFLSFLQLIPLKGLCKKNSASTLYKSTKSFTLFNALYIVFSVYRL